MADVKQVLKDLAGEAAPEYTQPQSADPDQCRCGHKREVHTIQKDGLDFCRYKSCTRCKGFRPMKFRMVRKLTQQELTVKHMQEERKVDVCKCNHSYTEHYIDESENTRPCKVHGCDCEDFQ